VNRNSTVESKRLCALLIQSDAESLCLCCRKVFEPFGGIRSAFSAARDGKPVNSQIEMASSEGLYTSDPDYTPPYVGDIELVFIAFDILFVDEEVCWTTRSHAVCMNRVTL